MAWDDGNNNDPWKPRGNQGPADLDAIVKDLQRKLSGLFGGRSSGDGGGRGPAAKIGTGVVSFIAVIVIGLWAATGFYTVDEAEQAVVLRFGDHASTAGPGLNWHMPFPIERVVKINTEEVVSWPYQGSMLTQDGNIIIVNLIVQYRRADPEAFLFSLFNPDLTLQNVTASAIREIVGKHDLDYILNEGRLDIADQALQLLQRTLDSYRDDDWPTSGITIEQVNMEDSQFPEPVQPLVREVIEADANRQERIYAAETYQNQVLPRAEGQAVRQIEDAEAYRAQVVNNAEGESSRFSAILREYQREPEVTRQRIHLETLEAIMSSSTKVLVDTEGGNNLLYLPLDQLVQQRSSADNSNQSGQATGATTVLPPSGISSSSPDRTTRR